MDRHGFERALAAYGDRVYSLAVWLLGDPEEAQDVVQQGLMRLWMHRSAVADGAACTWLTRTVHRLCIDRIRQNAARPRAALDKVLPLLSGGEPPAERRLERSELEAQIAEAMTHVSSRDRALIVMREMQDMSYAEIAQVLDMPISTLKPALHRARERLRLQLGRLGVQP
jgi:RNA polymerase sigma-70 factor (ECF subfamily)